MRSAPSELFEQAAKVATDNKVMAPANNFFFMITPFIHSINIYIIYFTKLS